MRNAFRSTAFAVALLLAGSGLADVVVLKDGRQVTISKPYVTKGRIAILTQPDGTLLSVPVADIDVAKSAAANAALKAAPPAKVVAAEAPKKPQTPAEAAKVKSGKRATVVLSDQDVARNYAEAEGEAKEKGEAEGKVTISGVSAVQSGSGYSISGSVANVGKSNVQGVTVTVEAIGTDNKVFNTVQANVAKESLAPDERAGFSAQVQTDREVKQFRYVPNWQVRVPVQSLSEADKAEVERKDAEARRAADEKAAQAAAQAPPPTPAPARPAPSRPDVAPAAANAPSQSPGAGSTAGYVPSSGLPQPQPTPQ